MEWTRGVLSATFLGFGIMCLLTLAYLAITWRLGIRINRKKTSKEDIDDIKNGITILAKRLHDLETEVGKVDDEGTTKIE